MTLILFLCIQNEATSQTNFMKCLVFGTPNVDLSSPTFFRGFRFKKTASSRRQIAKLYTLLKTYDLKTIPSSAALAFRPNNECLPPQGLTYNT